MVKRTRATEPQIQRYMLKYDRRNPYKLNASLSADEEKKQTPQELALKRIGDKTVHCPGT